MLDPIYAVELEPGLYVERAPTPWLTVFHSSANKPRTWRSAAHAKRVAMVVRDLNYPNAKVKQFRLVPVEDEK